jgi:hypothetical protein
MRPCKMTDEFERIRKEEAADQIDVLSQCLPEQDEGGILRQDIQWGGREGHVYLSVCVA